MRRLLLATIFATQLGCTPVLAQMSGMGMTTPALPPTSPLGMTPNAAVGPAGIPLGATELSSPGLSPVLGSPTLTPGTATAGSAATCPTTVNQSSSLSGSGISGLSTFDGGGISTGVVPSSLEGTTICTLASGNSMTTSTSTQNIAGGSVARTGIPLGSVQIGNRGVSPTVSEPIVSR
jgi:hypothetical protein